MTSTGRCVRLGCNNISLPKDSLCSFHRAQLIVEDTRHLGQVWIRTIAILGAIAIAVFYLLEK